MIYYTRVEVRDKDGEFCQFGFVDWPEALQFIKLCQAANYDVLEVCSYETNWTAEEAFDALKSDED